MTPPGGRLPFAHKVVEMAAPEFIVLRNILVELTEKGVHS